MGEDWSTWQERCRVSATVCEAPFIVWETEESEPPVCAQTLPVFWLWNSLIYLFIQQTLIAFSGPQTISWAVRTRSFPQKYLPGIVGQRQAMGCCVSLGLAQLFLKLCSSFSSGLNPSWGFFFLFPPLNLDLTELPRLPIPALGEQDRILNLAFRTYSRVLVTQTTHAHKRPRYWQS